MKRLNLTILVILFILLYNFSFSIQNNKTIYVGNNHEDGLLLKETFEDFGVDIEEIQFNYSNLIRTSMESSDIKILKRQVEEIFSVNLAQTSIENNKDYIKFQGNIKNNSFSNAKMNFVAIPSKESNKTFEVYLILKLSLKTISDYKSSYVYMTESLNALSLEPIVNVNIKGSLQKKLNHQEQEQIIRDMFRKLNGSIVEGLNEDNIISLTGYSYKLNSKYKSRDNFINLQIASSYDSDNNKTLFTIGTPLITMEH